MSTIILGRLAKRESTLRGTTDTTYWLEALAAVIPGETLAAYAVIIAFFTKDENGAASFTNEGAVRWFSLGLLVAIPIVYAASSGALLWPPAHPLRWFVAIVAFLAWLWLLPLSVWNTFDWIDWDKDIRAAVGVFAALVIVSLATYLFKRVPVDPPKG
jgi:hypothetical protein